MPLIYGEGIKAFRRLQEEILRASKDQSIFAWHSPQYPEGMVVDVLATSPSDFAESWAISRQPFFRLGREPITITSEGISCQLPLIRHNQRSTDVEAILDCQPGNLPATFPTIRLRSLSTSIDHIVKHYYRVTTSEMTKFQAHHTASEFLAERSVLGLDPTQLDQKAYKYVLGEYIVIPNLFTPLELIVRLKEN
jgi:hypothetical protein